MVDTDGRRLVLHAHPASIQDLDSLTFRQELAHAQTLPCRLGATTTGGLNHDGAVWRAGRLRATVSHEITLDRQKTWRAGKRNEELSSASCSA
jgi:hypothetical protein